MSETFSPEKKIQHIRALIDEIGKNFGNLIASIKIGESVSLGLARKALQLMKDQNSPSDEIKNFETTVLKNEENFTKYLREAMLTFQVDSESIGRFNSIRQIYETESDQLSVDDKDLMFLEEFRNKLEKIRQYLQDNEIEVSYGEV